MSDYEDPPDEVYCDVPEPIEDGGQEEDIYSDVDQDNDDLYDDLDNSTGTRQANVPPPPPIQSHRSQDAPPAVPDVPKKSPLDQSAKSKQFSPANLGLDSVRIRDLKVGLKKVSSPVMQKDWNDVPEKKCEAPQIPKNEIPPKKMPPIPLPTPKNATNDDNDDDDDGGDPIYEETDEMFDHQGQGRRPSWDDLASEQKPVPPVYRTPAPPIKSDGNTNFPPPLSIEKFDWFWGDVDRPTCEAKLKMHLSQDGSFLMRRCNKNKAEFAISLTYSGKIFHIIVRKRTDGKYAIGTVKENELAFDEPWELVQFYKNNSLELLPDEARKTKQGWVRLTHQLNK